MFFFPYNPHPLPPRIPTNPPGRPTREGLISVHFGSVWLRSGPFGSVRLRFGSVSCPVGGVGVGSVRGASVREENITMGDPLRRWKNIHHQKQTNICDSSTSRRTWKIFPTKTNIVLQTSACSCQKNSSHKHICFLADNEGFPSTHRKKLRRGGGVRGQESQALVYRHKSN